MKGFDHRVVPIVALVRIAIATAATFLYRVDVWMCFSPNWLVDV